jgi:hypothetical protein
MMETRFEVRFHPDPAPMPRVLELSDALLDALLELAISADRSTDDPDPEVSADNEAQADE